MIKQILVILLFIPLVNAIYEEEIYFDSDWKTHIVESREGYEETIHWNEPSYYMNYTKPNLPLNFSTNWMVLEVKKIDKKICYDVTFGDWTFDVKSTVNIMPLNKLVEWKNISFDSYSVIQIRYKKC